MLSICVFCGSRPGQDPAFEAAATAFGHLLAEQNINLVYGGGNVGLMGVIADAVLEKGGQVVGVIPDFLKQRELAHQGLTELHLVHSMHERKAKMAALSDGFVALPGGFGTFEELFEVITWGQLSLHHKPIGLLNTNGFYSPLLDFLSHTESQGFISPKHHAMLLHDHDPKALLIQLAQHLNASQPEASERKILDSM